ncbi:MAG: kinase [Candidatus Wolfebacteria bacterium]|nr:kinase [Candidatus Wolfebacteria bacterium]
MVITRTPFRISFFGGGTDYPAWYEDNGGAVLSTSIDKYCYITCRHLPPFFEHKSRIVWSKTELVRHHDEIQHPAVREALKFLNIDKGVEIHHQGDLPARSGLGSSSSFTVGLLHALHALNGKMITKYQLMLDAIHLEQERLKENVGSQDQAAVAFGGLNKIEFSGHHRITIRPIPINNEKLDILQNHLMIFFTGMARTASEIAAEQIKNTKQKGSELRKMLEIVNEAVKVLHGSADSFDDFGRLLHESWQIKRGLSSQITNPQIDEIYEAGRSAGALGGKLLGAGAGGFMLFFVKPEQQPVVKEKLSNLLHVPFLKVGCARCAKGIGSCRRQAVFGNSY